MSKSDTRVAPFARLAKAAWFASSLLVLACGRAGDRGQASAPAEPDASAECVGLACSECPPPQLELSSSEPVWSRNPATGNCCQYADAIVAPEAWPAFDSPAECRDDCRCATLEDYIPEVGRYITERTTLDCRCAAGACPASAAEAAASLCPSGRAALRSVGCGRVLIAADNDNAGDGWVFEGSLIGAYSFSDVSGAPCQTSTWIAGREFDCPEAVSCHLCGESSDPTLPPCE